MPFQTKLICYLLLFWSLAVSAQKYPVNVKVLCYPSYCGGARPSEEMLEEAQKAKPFANQTLVIISHKGKVCKVKTDAEGLIKLKLKSGSYKVKEPWRHSKTTPVKGPLSHFDQLCLTGEWEKVALEITILNGNVTAVPVNDIVLPCDWNIPCIMDAHRPPVAE